MNHDLDILNSQIIFSYSRNMEIRKRVFEFEDKLKENFVTPFRTVAIPNEIDPNIPRFDSQSKHNHSRIQVSQVRTTLATNFDENYTNTDAAVYLKEKRNKIQSLVETENIEFIAYVFELVTYIPENQINSILKENTKAIAIKDDCRDFTILYSKVYKNDFYLNIKCSKFTEEKITINVENAVPAIKHGISIIIDINSKVVFEKNEPFNSELYNDLEKHLFALIEDKTLNDYLQGNI
ncbi:hypothetical protein DNU06_17255 [Putridiphycobacter roseus]|uniref:TIGR04255 family protein n=1 Tax=Putridiphycobacter roseus TaxID=2219161 RepID=A0A2W1NLL2_9FLAO|nr:hypothetical protein [Putridiphycobacter roseus]PZE15598.1 hypothetical protein DNU06_17255 [Putridiphycobacter roseus]